MRKIKRFMAGVMSALMLVSMASFSVKAAETETDAADEIEIGCDENDINNVEWSGMSFDYPSVIDDIKTEYSSFSMGYTDHIYFKFNSNEKVDSIIRIEKYNKEELDLFSGDGEIGFNVYDSNRDLVLFGKQKLDNGRIQFHMQLNPGTYYLEVIDDNSTFESAPYNARCYKYVLNAYKCRGHFWKTSDGSNSYEIIHSPLVGDIKANKIELGTEYTFVGYTPADDWTPDICVSVEKGKRYSMKFVSEYELFDYLVLSGCITGYIELPGYVGWTDDTEELVMYGQHYYSAEGSEGENNHHCLMLELNKGKNGEYYYTFTAGRTGLLHFQLRDWPYHIGLCKTCEEKQKYNNFSGATFNIEVYEDPQKTATYNANCGHVDKAPGGIWDGTSYTNPDGQKVINAFFSDGTYTYFLDAYGNAMKDRLTYHPDGVHVIYFDENGHEVFSNFAHVKKAIAGNAVDDYCFFDVHGYMYVDVMTYDVTGKKLYYVNPYGQIERKGWFKFSNTAVWAGTTKKVGTGWGYGQADGTLMINKWTKNKAGKKVYMQGDGHMK